MSLDGRWLIMPHIRPAGKFAFLLSGLTSMMLATTTPASFAVFAAADGVSPGSDLGRSIRRSAERLTPGHRRTYLAYLILRHVTGRKVAHNAAYPTCWEIRLSPQRPDFHDAGNDDTGILRRLCGSRRSEPRLRPREIYSKKR